VLSLTAYFDESGTHEGSEAVALAGWLSTDERWRRFEAEWREALSDFGVDMFHMNKFANGAPPFKGWPEKKRQARLARLLTIINRHALGSVGWVINKPLYDKVVAEKAQSICGSPYGLAAVACFTDVASAMRGMKIVDAWVAYVFEKGTEGQADILKMFNENMRDPARKEHFRLLSLRFEDKRKYLPLQAADILAYELYQHFPRQLGLSRRSPRAYVMSRLSERASYWGYYEEQELRKASDALSVVADFRAGRR